VNVQVIAGPAGPLIWVSPALAGARHDIAAALIDAGFLGSAKADRERHLYTLTFATNAALDGESLRRAPNHPMFAEIPKVGPPVGFCAWSRYPSLNVLEIRTLVP
jgi:hypothetical protein